MFAINMSEKNQSTDDEGQHEAPSEHLGVADILIGISSKNDPPSPNNVAKSVRYYKSGATRIEQSEDNVDEGYESSSSGDLGAGNIAIPTVASMPRTRRHQSSSERIAPSGSASRDATATSATTKKPISPARHVLMAKRRQIYLFRMQERRRVQSFREKAVMQMARNMLSPEQVKEMEEAIAEKKRRQQQEQRRNNGIASPPVVEDTKESNHGKQN